MENGYVLVMSEWDDGAAHMLWLDSNYPPDADPSKPGVSSHVILVTLSYWEYSYERAINIIIFESVVRIFTKWEKVDFVFVAGESWTLPIGQW